MSPIRILTESRQAIVELLKREGSATIAEVADALGFSYETVRQHLAHFEDKGWIQRKQERSAAAGRPAGRYSLTAAAEHLFPKAYEDLSLLLIDTFADQFGVPALEQVLTALTDQKVEQWAPRLEGKELDERLEILRDLYAEGDPHTVVEKTEDGGLRLIERNCPFLEVALQRPALCSLTVSTLTRLLGAPVVREETFQNGDGACCFRVLSDAETDPEFRFGFEAAETDE